MKKVFLLLSAFFAWHLHAQEDPNFRQAENLLRNFNPAFNGLEDFDKRSIMVSFRHQIDKIAGAPLTFAGSYGGHFDKLHGGADISYTFDRIGYQTTSWVGLKYDAQFKLGEKFNLGFGTRVSSGFIKFNFDSLHPFTPDPALPTGIQHDVIIPDVDFGLMLTSGKAFFFSLSARHLTEPYATATAPNGDQMKYGDQYRTFYAQLGGDIKAGEHWQFKYAADYRMTAQTGYGEARAEVHWRFLYASFYCVLDKWKDEYGNAKYLNPYGFSVGFSRTKGKFHWINSYEPEFDKSGFGSGVESGMKYVFRKKDE